MTTIIICRDCRQEVTANYRMTDERINDISFDHIRRHPKHVVGFQIIK